MQIQEEKIRPIDAAWLIDKVRRSYPREDDLISALRNAGVKARNEPFRELAQDLKTLIIAQVVGLEVLSDKDLIEIMHKALFEDNLISKEDTEPRRVLESLFKTFLIEDVIKQDPSFKLPLKRGVLEDSKIDSVFLPEMQKLYFTSLKVYVDKILDEVREILKE